MPRVRAAVLFVFVLSSTVSRAADETQAQLQKMQEQLQALSQRVENQDKTIADQQRKIEDQQRVIHAMKQENAPVTGGPLAEIMRKVDRADRQSANAIKIASRTRKDEVDINVGVALDTAYRYFDGENDKAGRPGGHDFSLQSMELIFQGKVDNLFASYVVINAASDAEDNDEAIPAVEEAAIYTTFSDLYRVKGGRMFVPVGRLSAIHQHELPFASRPASIENYIGGESGGDGVQAQALLPFEERIQLTGGVFNKIGAEFPLLNAAEQRRNAAELTYFAKMLGTVEFGSCKEHEVTAGLSFVFTPDELINRNLLNFELLYAWRPEGRDRLVWGTEIMRNEIRSALEIPSEIEDEPSLFTRERKTGYGGYSYLEYYVNRKFSLGPRVDLFQNTDPNEETRRTYQQTYSLFATYRFSEASLVRFEANRHEYFDGDSANSVFLQWVVRFGAHSHPHEIGGHTGHGHEHGGHHHGGHDHHGHAH